MKLARFLLILWVLALIVPSCSSAEKAANQRRGLMMPQKSELKKNSKYKPTKSQKTYKNKKKKKRK